MNLQCHVLLHFDMSLIHTYWNSYAHCPCPPPPPLLNRQPGSKVVFLSMCLALPFDPEVVDVVLVLVKDPNIADLSVSQRKDLECMCVELLRSTSADETAA